MESHSDAKWEAQQGIEFISNSCCKIWNNTPANNTRKNFGEEGCISLGNTQAVIAYEVHNFCMVVDHAKVNKYAVQNGE